MWIINTDGLYSVVAVERDPDVLLVRCRTPDDAKRMADRLAPRLGGAPVITHTPERDYAYRMTVPRAVFSRVVGETVDQIDYTNFKDAVGERRGWIRESVYADVWLVLRSGLQRAVPGGRAKGKRQWGPPL